MDTLFDASIQSEQYQIGQKNVNHITHGACDITKVETYKGKIFYEIVVISTKLKLKCIGTKLRCDEVQS